MSMFQVGVNAYIDVVYFRDYHALRGTTFAQSDAVIQQGIVRATDYMEARWGGNYKGRKAGVQPLSFPRIYLYDREGNPITGVPDAVKWACAEYTKIALDQSLFPTIEAGRPVKRTFEQVGPLIEEKEYEGYVQPLTTPYPLADRMLAQLVYYSGGVERG